MTETDPTKTPPEPGSEAAAAAAGEGGEGGAGGDAAAEQFAAEREQLQREARLRQSEADKAKAETARLQRELDEAKKGTSGEETPAPSAGLTEEQVRQVMRREAARASEMSSAVETARSEFPNADPKVLSNLESYDSADELLVAAKASHDTLSEHLSAREKSIEEDIRKRYAAIHGELPAPPDNSGKDTPTGDPTITQLSAMSQAELEALEKRAPGTIERVLNSADQL